MAADDEVIAPASPPALSSNEDTLGLFGDRKQRKRLAYALLATSVLGLSALTVATRKSSIEKSLQASVEDALAVDHPGLQVSVDGRDVTIRGAVDNDDAKDAIRQIAEKRRGVRTVSVSNVKGLADPGANTTKVPLSTEGGSDTQGADSTGSADTAAGTDTTAGTGAPNRLPAAAPKITGAFDGTTMTVGGEVPDSAAKDALLGRLQQATSLTVVDNLAVSASPTESADMAEYRRVGTFLSFLTRLPVASANVSVDRTIVSLTAEVNNASDRDLLEREALKLVNGTASNLSNSITVKGATAGDTTATDTTDAQAVTTTTVADNAAPGAVTVPPLPTTPEAQKAQADITSSINGRTIKFNKNSIKLSNDDKALIADVAAALKTNASAKVEIGGHTDYKGSASSNQQLSQQRADAVRQALVDSGIDTARVTAKGYGEDVPIADNTTPQGQAKNRRIEFRVVA